MLFFLLQGCAERDATVKDSKNTLLKSENVKIYNIDIDKMLKENGYYKKLHEFPFISSNAVLDFRGNFPVEFYQSFDFNVKAKNLKDVNFWNLRDYPFSLDVIYVKPIWLENFKYVSKDLFENICYSYNISKREQEILKWWIKNGGIFWVESGIYATGFENIHRDGTINLKAIKRRVYKLTNGLHFLEFPVKTSVYLQKSKELTTYRENIVTFNRLRIRDNFLKSVKVLQIKLNHPIEALFSISYKPVIRDGAGRPLLSITPYAGGKIIFLFPFEYVDSYKDGELLRWKLLEYIYTHPHYSTQGRNINPVSPSLSRKYRGNKKKFKKYNTNRPAVNGNNGNKEEKNKTKKIKKVEHLI